MKRALYRFRYRIYVEQMGRRQQHADHLCRLVEEPMDVDARNFAVFRGEEIVAAIRANAADDPAIRYYRRLYRIDALGVADVSRVQVTTKLMVRPELRRTTLAARLLAHYGEDTCRRGMQLDVMDCNGHLVPMFERLGYHSYCGWVFHREYGTVRAMVCAADTVAYLEAIRSPLAAGAAMHVTDGAYGGYALLGRVAARPALVEVDRAFERYVLAQRPGPGE